MTDKKKTWREELDSVDPLDALRRTGGGARRRQQPGQADRQDAAQETLIPLARITLDKAAQPRVQMDEATIESYAADMAGGAKFPPVIIFQDGDTLYLADGFHRYYAAEAVGADRIRAEIRQGGLRDAVLYSIGANTKHGLRRTNADKKRAVLAMLQDSEWQQWSDRQIAKQAGVSNQTVSNYRSSLSNFDSKRTYIDKYGNVVEMETNAITPEDRRRGRVHKFAERIGKIASWELPPIESRQEKVAIKDAIRAARDRLDKLESEL